MKHIIRNKSFIYVVAVTVLAVVLSVSCLTQKVSSENDTYVLGRSRISYTVPITPMPTCLQEKRVGRVNFTEVC